MDSTSDRANPEWAKAGGLSPSGEIARAKPAGAAVERSRGADGEALVVVEGSQPLPPRGLNGRGADRSNAAALIGVYNPTGATARASPEARPAAGTGGPIVRRRTGL